MKTPYITDRPLCDGDPFFGRSAEIDAIGQALRDGRRILALFGTPCIGKTSLINHLASHLAESSLQVRIVPWPSRDLRVTAPPDALREIVSQAMDGIACTDGTSGHAMNGLSKSVFDTEGTSPRLLLCVDGIPEDVWGEGLRASVTEVLTVIDRYPGLALILIVQGLPDPRPTCGEVWSLALGPLGDIEAEDLLVAPARGRLAYDAESVRRILRLSGGEPLLLQRIGDALYRDRQQAGWVGVAEVDKVMPHVLSGSDADFRRRWDRLDADEKLTLAAFASMPGTHGIATGCSIGLYLSQLRIDHPLESVGADLCHLAQQGLLQELGGGTHRFRSELFRSWVREAQPVEHVIAETGSPRRRAARPRSRVPGRHIDWAALVLWTIAGVLTLLVIAVWQRRETIVMWTGQPTPPGSAATTSPVPVALPSMVSGISPGRLAYAAKAHPDDPWDIYVMRSDGSDPQRLTDDPADNTLPALSPDGQRIAFVSNRDGNREIYVMSSDGSSQVNLTLHGAEDWTPSWSPDGNRLTFASYRDGNWEIYVMDADGADVQRLTENAFLDYAPSWSPDGQEIAFVSNRSGNLDIFVMDADGSEVRAVTSDPATDQSPVWAPDGSEIAWESYREGHMEILAAKPDGTDVRSLSRDAYADDHGATWSPWGTQIAFFSNRDGGWDIYTVDLDTGQRENITASPMIEQSPSWGR